MRRSPRRRRRWLLVIGIGLLLLSGTAFAYLRVKLEGADLAEKIAALLNKRMRGRIEIGAVEWPTSALKTVVTGGWVPVTVRDVKVWDDCVLSADVAQGDPEQLRVGDPNEDCTPDDRPDPNPGSKRKPRKLLIKAPLLTGEIDLHALMFGRHDFVFRNLWVHGGEALLEQTREPYPLHAYDRTIVSIVTAFYPRMKAGFRAGIYADAPGAIFDLRDIHVEHLNMTVHMAPYTTKDGIGFGMSMRVEDVNADADPAHLAHDNYLHMDPTDPLVAKFYVRLALETGHAHVRIFDEGPRNAFHMPNTQGVGDDWGKGRSSMYDLELADISLKRLAQMPTEWAKKDYVANTLELDLTAHTLPCKTSTGGEPQAKDGAELHVSGELNNYWDRPYDGTWNLALDVKNLGPTLNTCIKSKMGGDNLGGRITLTGPFIAPPKITLDLHGLDYFVPLRKQADPLWLTLAEVHGEIDLVNDQGSIDKTKAQIRGGKEPGEVMVSATFGVKPYNATASIDIVKPIDVGRFLPDPIPTSVGHFLGGKLTAVGDVDKGFALEDFDLTLGPTPTDKLVHVHKGRIFTNDNFGQVGIQKVAVEAGQSHAVFDGYVDTIKAALHIRIDGNFPDLDIWLRRFGLPQFAKSAGGGQIVIDGPLSSPTVALRLKLDGVPCMGSLTLDASVKDKIATVAHVSSEGLGGKIDGHGVISLAQPKVIQSFHLEGRKLDAARLCGLVGTVKGTLDIVDVDVKKNTTIEPRPAVDWIAKLSAYVKAEHLSIVGDGYSRITACINHPDDAKLCQPQQVHLGPDDNRTCTDAKQRNGACVIASADRDRGGRFAAMVIDVPALRAGRTTTPRHLGGTIDIADVPLTVLDQWVTPGTLGGLLSASLHLQGANTAPQAEGTLWLIRSWLKGAFVGDSQLAITPLDVGHMPSLFIHGDLLAHQLGISGTIGTQAPYPVDLAITGRRIEVDQFIDLAKKLGMTEPVQAWASGTVTVHTELAPLDGKPAHPEAWVELTELEAIVDHRARDGRAAPLRFNLQPGTTDPFAMSLRVTPQTIELACRDLAAQGGRRPCKASLETPAGVVTISGGATQSQMDLHATGTLLLAKLGNLLENQVDEISGSLGLQADITGTFAKPTYRVELTINNQINVRPSGVDTTLQVLPGGQVLLAAGALGFNQITVRARDPRANEQGELHVKGTIGLAGLRPDEWSMLIDGKIAGKMLLAIAPNAVAQASGLATIDGAITLFGKGALPQVTGTLTFDPDPDDKHPTPFSFSPRGARKEIALLGGSVDISTTAIGEHRTYALSIADNPVTASVDGEGRIQNVRGDAVLRDGVPQSARVYFDGENIPFRIPGTLDLTIGAKDISLELPHEGAAWIARGNISIVSGKYQRNFELTEVIKPEPPAIQPARPFWDEYPSIGNADLSLTLDVRRFNVQNNIADIELEGPNILIRGSPRDLRLAGSIRVQRGIFKIPGTRAQFTRTLGSIDFAENERATNPRLDIQSDADYLDLSGQVHIITLNIIGTLEQPLWDLKTSTGYNKSQTLALLFLGRNPEQLRRTLGDQAPGSNPQIVEQTTNPSQGFADQIVKDLAGDWVSGLLGESLTKLTKLDVLRFEVGFGSVGIHAEKKALENFKAIGDGEQTIRGQTLNLTLEVKTPWHPLRVVTDDQITLQGVYLDKNFYDPAEQDIQDLKVQGVFRLFIP